ncbi:translation elongation factor Ts [Candidatus Shapirobacteria bacterium]|nr:translation elongation factor Ts [Candidatus Shapirobacteria bacterium]
MLNLVKKLREETGAGVIACKKTLEETRGNYQKALILVKKKGLVKAEEKTSRATKEGYVATYTHATGRIGVVVELLCETDFVARNLDFQKFGKELCLQVAALKAKTAAGLLKQEYIREPEKKISQLVKEMIAKFGENIKIGKIARVEI